MTSGWQWKFPATRTCLWDGSPLANSEELSLAKNGRVFVQLSVSALHRALSHARMGTLKVLDCYMIATAWIDNAEIIVVEVNRFDPGRTDHRNRTAGLLPTSLMAGDIPIATQVVLDAPSESSYLSHNLHNLQNAISDLANNLSRPLSNLDPAPFISLRLHCACSEEGSVTVQCGSVLPSVSYVATPIRPIPIVQTALARNLSGPLPISVLQGKYKYGFLTMDSCRKLLLLLHSDPKVSSLPLVGVWVSGVETGQHPMVWAACSSYTHSAALSDRVWGEGHKRTFLLLLYLKGTPQAHFMQCQVGHTSSRQQTRPVACSMSSAETKFQWMPDMKHVELELLPVSVSSSLHTLLETAWRHTEQWPLSSSSGVQHENMPPQPPGVQHETMPPQPPGIQHEKMPPEPSQVKPHLVADRLSTHLSPSPAPERVLRDSNLSVISSLSVEDQSFTQHSVQEPAHSNQAGIKVRSNTTTASATANVPSSITSIPPRGGSLSLSSSVGGNTLSSVVSDRDFHESVLPSQEERMGVALAARCLDVLQQEGRASLRSEAGSTSLGEFVSREMNSVSRETSTVSVATCSSGDSRGTTVLSQDNSTMYLDLRSYVDSISSSEGRSDMSKTPQPPKESSEEDSRASYSHLLKENEAEYYKLLLNQVLGQQQEQDVNNKAANSICMDSGNWHPPSHSTTLHEESKLQKPSSAIGPVMNAPEALRGNDMAGPDYSHDFSKSTRNSVSANSSTPSMHAAMTSNPDSNNLHSILRSSSGSNGGRPGEIGSRDVSLLSLPPSGINTMLLTAGLWGLDLSVDEDLHHADLIGRKYLQGTSGSASTGDHSIGGNNGGLHRLPLDEGSVNQTLALSTTMYQFLERHDIMHRHHTPASTRQAAPEEVARDPRQAEGLGGVAHPIPSNPPPTSRKPPLVTMPRNNAPSSRNCNILDVEKTRALQKFT